MEKAGKWKIMDNRERRAQLYKMLEQGEESLSGTYLSKVLNVTRQIIVGDVAILRSGGKKILSTARGYKLEDPEKGKEFWQDLNCQSQNMDAAELEDELNVVVDNGGIIHGMTLSHAVYGIIRIAMDLYSRRDVRQYMDRLRKEKGLLITALTQGKHTLSVETRNKEDMNALKEGLKGMGLLVPCESEKTTL